MIRTIWIASLMLVLVADTACTNIFENFANTESDQALYDSALSYNDQHDYDSALAQFSKMSPSAQSERKVLALWASAYAGRGGLDLLTFISAVQNMGTTNLFLFLMQNFESGSDQKMADLLAAQSKILQISTTVSDLTNDELMELTVIALGNMGTILSRYDDTGHDGTPDGNVCTTAFPAYGTTPAPGDAVAQFIVSLNWVLSAVTQLSTNGVDFGPSAMTAAQSVCDALTSFGGGVYASYAFCGVTSSTAVTNNQYLGALSLINESSAGIGLATCTGDIVACKCF
jgi:hypothetical protein